MQSVGQKTETLADRLATRIRHGDYLVREIPAERELAELEGVSRMTARKALSLLVKRGLLCRQENGRVAVTPLDAGGQGFFAFLVPSITSTDVEYWRLAIERVARERGVNVRMLMYRHWQDPIIESAIRSFDRALIYLAAEPMPETVRLLLAESARHICAVDRDLSEIGVPSLSAYPPKSIRRLLDHLGELGHRHVDCFNVQPVDPVITGRIEQWNLWRATHRLQGRLLGEPEHASKLPVERAVAEFSELLDRGQILGTAVFCPTAPAAIGAVRAMADRGLKAGVDLSICAANDESIARYMTPSITSLLPPDPTPQLRLCFERLLDSDRDWIGPLLLEHDDVPLFKGESTGPPTLR